MRLLPDRILLGTATVTTMPAALLLVPTPVAAAARPGKVAVRQILRLAVAAAGIVYLAIVKKTMSSPEVGMALTRN